MKLNKNNTYTITRNGNKVEVPVSTAKQMHHENEIGNGASTIGIEFGFTTNQADALIDAYRRDFVNTGIESEEMTAEAIRNYLTDTVAVSEDKNKTCRIVSRKNNETILVVKFSHTPTQEEIEYTVRKIVENEDFIPTFLVPVIIRQVEATVVFKMKLS